MPTLRLRVAIPLLLVTTLLMAALVILSLSSGGTSTTDNLGSPRTPEGQPAAAAQAASPRKQRFDGAELPQGVLAPPFTLEDQEGRRLALTSLRGKVVILGFLYSTCGATCI